MAVRQGMLPNSTEFKKFVVKIMYQTKDYEKARKKLKEAECKSDLQTEAEEEEVTKKRTKRPNPKYDDSDTESSDSDSEIRPRSPKKKKENFANTANTASTAPTAHPTITSQGQWTKLKVSRFDIFREFQGQDIWVWIESTKGNRANATTNAA